MKISVIIPCYNAAAFVVRAVESVVQQDYPDKEIIIVDDGSTDRTREVLTSLRRDYPAINLVFSDNRGACAARNTGFENSSGEYLLFLDADDELLQGRISSAAAVLASGKSPSILAGSFIRKSAGKTTEIRASAGEPWVKLFNGELGCTCSNLFQRKAFVDAGKWNEELRSSQEAELMCRILQKNPLVKYDEQFLTVVHADDSIISRREPTENLRRYFDVRLTIYDNIIKLNPEDESIKSNAGSMFYGIVHRMYSLDRDQAWQMLELLKHRHIGIAQGPGVSRSYRILYGIFGFRITEGLFYSRK